MAIPLSKAPDSFFDQQHWLDFISYFDTPETALARISYPPSLPVGYYRPQDPNLPPPNEDGKEKIEKLYLLGNTLIRAFRDKLIREQIIATGLSFDSSDRVSIPPEQWKRLWPNFAEDKAMGDLFELTQVQLTRNDDRKTRNAELKERCIAFLQAQRSEGEGRKKILQAKALDHFGGDLTVRVFDASYKIVFKRRLGRPRRTK
jgi:hypothetical protein